MPDWVKPVAEYMLKTGLKETARMAATAVVASAIIGVVMGTLLTIRFLPLRSVIRLYIEVWRGLPIIVTIFLIYFALPGLVDIRFDAFTAAAIGWTLWGSAQVAEATRGAVPWRQPAFRAAAGPRPSPATSRSRRGPRELSSRPISEVASSERSSTTTTSNRSGGRRCASRAARRFRRRTARFLVATTTVTSGPAGAGAGSCVGLFATPTQPRRRD